jgi:hypothetical protein
MFRCVVFNVSMKLIQTYRKIIMHLQNPTIYYIMFTVRVIINKYVYVGMSLHFIIPNN